MVTWNPRANDIFLDALEIRDPVDRAAFVDEKCHGEPELHEQVLALIAATEQAGSFLDRPALTPRSTATCDLSLDLDTSTGSSSVAELVGTIIAGRYKLLEQIGEGGMGTVYLAEQTHPVRRKIALKVIKPGMDSRQVVARFEAERQALALMDHANISRVFDGGTTDSGRPFFVMELVHGVPITKYCDDNRLSPRQRLDLFVPVCQAIQHAHQKGIIHRDIKPSNVMVTLYDGRPVPKVIDFGVAKATEQKLTERTLFTGYGSVVGTLEYMSPEQAEMSALGVDTRSDIYSLGVLLYELLTGTTPLDRKRMKQASFSEILRQIKEVEPPRPSTRLSDSGEALASISVQRQMEPAKLTRLVRGELDWIVMKCLEKDRVRRYETANGLAADLQRYLADEPVLACPPSAVYRLKKFARRNRGPVLASTILAGALMCGIVGTTWGLVKANAARADAERESGLKTAALRDADEKLFASYLEQARALRTSRRPGQRFECLAVLRRAAELARELKLPAEKFDELRDAAVAALALPDLNPTGPWVPFSADAPSIDFDDAHTIYARTDIKGNCTVRRVADDVEIHSLPGRGQHTGVHFRHDGRFLAINHYDGGPPFVPTALEVWELGPGAARKVVSAEKAGFAVFHPRLPQVAWVYSDGAIGLFDLPSGLITRLPPDTMTREVNLALHPTEPVVAVSSYFARPPVVQLRDLSTGKVLKTLEQDSLPMSLAWSPDGRTLAVGSDIGLGGGRIRLYDRDSLHAVRTLEGVPAVSRLSFNPAGDRLATVGWGGEANLFDLGTGQKLIATTPMAGHPRFSRDGRRLTGACQDSKVGFLEVGDGREYRTLVRQSVPGKSHSHQVAVSRDGRLVAAAMSDGIGLWDLASGSELAFILMSVWGGKGVAFEASGALLTLGPTGVSRWQVNADPAAPERVTVGPPEPLRLPIGHALGQSRDGRVIVTCARPINVLQPYAGGWVRHTDRPDPPIRLDAGADIGWITVSPDGRWVVTVVHETGLTKVWDAHNGQLEKQFDGWRAGAVQFSPDSRWLSTDLDGGRLIAVGTWEPGPRVGGAGTFSPDGKIIAVPTGSGFRLVEAANGRTLVTLEDPNLEPANHPPVFTTDGTRLIASTNVKGKGIRVWDLRLIRQQLAELGLDWDAPPYPPVVAKTGHALPLTVKVRTGMPTGPTLTREEKARRNIDILRARHEANKNDPAVCNNLAWALLTAPEPLRDVKAAVPLAERAAKLAPKNAVFENTLGTAYYRAGRYREAVDILRPNLDRQADKYLAYELYFLAMSHHRLGETGRAKDYFAWANRWERTQSGLTPDEVAELNEFRAEAAVVLGLSFEVAPPPRKQK